MQFHKEAAYVYICLYAKICSKIDTCYKMVIGFQAKSVVCLSSVLLPIVKEPSAHSITGK